MKATDECYGCLGRLVRQAATLATEDPGPRATAIDEGLKLLDREFSTNRTSTAVATLLHRQVRETAGSADPYCRIKEAEVALARELLRILGLGPAADLRDCLILAVRGNCIDFFKDLESVREDLVAPVKFAVDHTGALEAKLQATRAILYLADNAGEVLFDMPLVEKLGQFAPVTYVVKQAPVQNDVTLADLDKFGLTPQLPRTLSTGTDTPGVEWALASSQFKAAFEEADLVVAKGMGYWETLTELPAQGKVLYLLKAKCRPVAGSLGVPLDSYVALFR